MATLGEQSIGSIVKLNVNGAAWNFIVVHQGLPGTMYDASCDGTWLLMEYCYEARKYGGTNHDYENSDIHSYLNNTFVNLFDSDIKSVIKQVKIPYRKGSGSSTTVSSGSNGLSAKVFLLSYTEIGLTKNSYDYAPAEGAALSYFKGAADSKRICATIDNSVYTWWLRSPRLNNDVRYCCVSAQGTCSYGGVTASRGMRPAMVLDPSAKVLDDGTITLKTAAISGTVNIDGVERELTGEGYVNIDGVLRELSDSQANIDSIIKSLKG